MKRKHTFNFYVMENTHLQWILVYYCPQTDWPFLPSYIWLTELEFYQTFACQATSPSFLAKRKCASSVFVIITCFCNEKRYFENKRPRSTLSTSINGSRNSYIGVKKPAFLSAAVFVETLDVTYRFPCELFRCHSCFHKIHTCNE